MTTEINEIHKCQLCNGGQFKNAAALSSHIRFKRREGVVQDSKHSYAGGVQVDPTWSPTRVLRCIELRGEINGSNLQVQDV